MDIKKILKYAGVGIAVILVAIFAVMGFVIFDVMSYTATGSQTLNATGSSVGNALIVYDPGISGEPKDVSITIAKNLQAKGYNVDLAGIKSSVASNTSGYSIVVVGGPIYGGKISSSVQSYLKSLKISEGTALAVFAVGQDPDTAGNEALLRKEIVITGNNSLNVTGVMKVITGEDPSKKSSDFVLTILE